MNWNQKLKSLTKKEFDLNQVGEAWVHPDRFDFDSVAKESSWSKRWIQILNSSGWIYQGTVDHMARMFEDKDYPIVGVRRMTPVKPAHRIEYRRTEGGFEVWKYDSRNGEERMLARDIQTEIYAEEITNYYSDMLQEEQIALERAEGAKNEE
jgi:hypothetical protein